MLKFMRLINVISNFMNELSYLFALETYELFNYNMINPYL